MLVAYFVITDRSSTCILLGNCIGVYDQVNDPHRWLPSQLLKFIAENWLYRNKWLYLHPNAVKMVHSVKSALRKDKLSCKQVSSLYNRHSPTLFKGKSDNFSATVIDKTESRKRKSVNSFCTLNSDFFLAVTYKNLLNIQFARISSIGKKL